MFDNLKRLYTICKAEINSALNKLENPIEVAEQGVLDLKKDLSESLKSLSEIESLSIQEARNYKLAKDKSDKYEQESIRLLELAENGRMSPGKADDKAKELLEKKLLIDKQVVSYKENVDKYDSLLTKMRGNIQKLENEVKSWEEDIKIIKARKKVSDATLKLNKQFSDIDSDNTMSRLERIRDQIEEQEILTESYESIANSNLTVDEEIDRALAESTEPAAPSDLEQRMQPEPPSEPNHQKEAVVDTELNRLQNKLKSTKKVELELVEKKPNALTELELLREQLNNN